MFDITKAAASDTAWLHLKDASGELIFADAERTKPVRLCLYGPGSKAFGVVDSRRTARVLKRMNDNEGKVTEPPYEEKKQNEAEDYAALTVRSENFAYPPAGKAEGTELFTAFYLDATMGHFFKQVRQFIADWGNFKGA